jgi:hypothetical protein
LDKDRQIRMLIPPFFLAASVLWAAYLSGALYPFLHVGEHGNDAGSLRLVLSMFGVVGVSTLPLGYAISALWITILRAWPASSLFPQHRHYEMPISNQALGEVWLILGVSRSLRLDSSAVAAFDHALLEPRIHDWLARRWNSFNISTSCITALLLSWPLGRALHLPVLTLGMWRWWLLILFLVAVFVWRSVESWREVKRMFDLVVHVRQFVRPEGSRRDGRADGVAG